MNPEWIGYVAAVFTTAAYIPQTIKVFRHRHTAGISLGMYALITCGIALWFVYGVLIDSLPIMLTNGITFVMTSAILVMKIRHG
ncbi:MAG: SemiSWEET transporter [Pseudomonadota bacterium]|nr:SemiSWEET transporter [Pseudomonadota bacterium]MDE3038273.1 SemiSWEET transporter [Pseudomonadota bacterium]